MAGSRGRSKERSSSDVPSDLGKTVTKRIWTPGPTQILGQTSYSGTLGYKREAVAYEVNEGPPFKTGGPFRLRRYELVRATLPHKRVRSFDYGSWIDETNYDITQFGDFSSLGLPNSVSSSTLGSRYGSVAFPSPSLENYAAEAMNKINPTNISKANLALTLVELLREGIPSVPGVKALKQRLRTGSVRDAYRPEDSGKGYLNLQFGWAPLVSELQNVIDAFENSVTVYNQLVRDNNRSVRRRATLYRDVTTSIASSNNVYCYPIAWNGRNMSGKASTATTRTSTRVWTVGRGKYFIPDIRTEKFQKRLTQELLGTRPNLALVYELMPWSWMIDWVSNLGEVIQYHLGPQVSEFVIDYAYIMRHVQKDVTYNMPSYETDSFLDGTSLGKVPSFTARERFETKERIAASSFGFGLTLQSLSAKQLAILAALGVSKTRF